MRTIVAALMLDGLIAASPVRAQEAQNQPQGQAQQGAADDMAVCDVPAYLTSTDDRIAKTAEAIKTQRKLDILVIGSGSSALPGPDGAASAYPARLQESLRKRLDGITVNVATELLMRQTAEQVAESVDKIVAARKPVLVVWQTGTSDAIRGVNPDDFRVAVDDGVNALKASGVDIILLNPQYSPRSEALLSMSAYLDTMRAVAQQHEVPLFDRFAIMRHWQDAGDFDLLDASKGLGLAKRVHECLGRALALMIIESSGIKPGDFKVQR